MPSYVAILQYLQYIYQKDCLYRLRHIAGWIQILIIPKLHNKVYFQLMNIYEVSWQVPALSLLFLSLGCGNIITTSMTIPLKLQDSKTGQLKYRFTRLDKYFWSHRRRRNSVSQIRV